jgi:hypothetical protein
LPDGVDTAVEDCTSVQAAKYGAGGAVSSRTSWASRIDGKVPARVPTIRKRAACFVRKELIELSHPAAGVNASSLLTDAQQCSKSWMLSGRDKRLIP